MEDLSYESGYLKTELDTFEAHLDELLISHLNQYVLIKGTEIKGTYASSELEVPALIYGLIDSDIP